MKIIVFVPRTLLPPPSPPLAGERLPSSESALALLLLSSVMGVNFNTPFDDVVSVGAEEEDDEDDDGDFEEDESDDEELDPSEFDDTALASDPSRLESSLELLSASEPEALGPTDPELETRSAVSDDDEDGKLLATAVELELDSTFKLAELVSALADAASEDVDATTDPLASDGDPPADPLAPEANKDPVDGVELDVELTESSIKDPEPEELGDRSPDDESAPFPPDEDAASELDADGGIAVTGAGLVAVAVGVEVGVGGALPESEPEFEEGIAVTGGGLVGLGIGVAVGVGVPLESEFELDPDGGIAVTGGGLVGPDIEPLDDSVELESIGMDPAELDSDDVAGVVTVGVAVVAMGASVVDAEDPSMQVDQ
ncbi:hypothetical protein PF002_g5671 [Phytophthora fragariae]|uniref:Uncharacterized protein n=1 Tax=Phytophthora fragariae TaxID=53985 RepID=A0A6A4A3B7_9STRA|nr:hypothetical protein PF002_g5671 [Phytophthora fragariae]